MSGFPATIVEIGHVEPVPRRIRATLGGVVVLDTTNAWYLWEWAHYPQYYVPIEDVHKDLLVDENHAQNSRHGKLQRYGLRVGEIARERAAKLYTESTIQGLVGRVRFDWDALDAWYEEDEQVFVHPRDPYTRVDALRSLRAVRVELDGVVLAESPSSVMVFETGLPTRYYLDRTALHLDHLLPTDTETACPYKGVTSSYWSIKIGDSVHEDLAWAYNFPTRQLQPITGLVAFYNEKVDIFIDGEPLERPQTHFFKSDD